MLTALGILVLWCSSRRPHARWSDKELVGSILIGFGIFNVVEGTVNDHLLGIHHVNETVPRDQWVYWDVAFLLWGAGMLVAGWILLRLSRRLVPSGKSARWERVQGDRPRTVDVSGGA